MGNVKNSTLEHVSMDMGQSRKLDFILGRIDLIAILTALLGVVMLGVAAMVMAVYEIGKIIVYLWADTFDRWLMITIAVALAWVITRRKNLCVR